MLFRSFVLPGIPSGTPPANTIVEQVMKRLVIKNKRKIWLWFLFIVLLILACRAAYVTGNKNMQIRDEAVEEQQVENVVGQDKVERLC